MVIVALSRLVTSSISSYSKCYLILLILKLITLGILSKLLTKGSNSKGQKERSNHVYQIKENEVDQNESTKAWDGFGT